MPQPITPDVQARADRIIRAIRREEERAAMQRTLSAIRRAQLLRQAEDVLGTQRAVARQLGVSPQAVSKALADPDATRGRLPNEQPINYLPLELAEGFTGLGYGEFVVTPQEWETIEDPDQQQEAATEAAAAWHALALLTDGLSRALSQLIYAYADVNDYPEEDTQSPSQVQQIILDECAWTPNSMLPINRDGARRMSRLLGYLADSFGDHGARSWKEVEKWRDRAGQEQTSIENAL
ncbi:hypothetical protein [Streptomyces sp. NPDC050485]|uniref:hypothetical protein n=1 Tax=Streptomyces sp. NPDC050485 TaxID=3365617 RepID=UPI00379AD6CE